MTREPFIAHSELTNEIYIIVGKKKYRVTEQAIKAVIAIKALEQEPFINKPCVSSGVCEHDKNEVLNKIRAEIDEYGSIWVQYQITGRSDKDIQQLVSDVLKQAKEQVLEIIDKYKAETEAEDGNK